ncbi:MAG: hypothetical protein ACR2KG_10700 [Nocardioidaceae bacterium]
MHDQSLAVLMIPWSIYLGMALPHRAVARHYDAAWAGFDIGLASVAIASAVCLELPLAGVCLWMALNGQRTMQRRFEMLGHREARN